MHGFNFETNGKPFLAIDTTFGRTLKFQNNFRSCASGNHNIYKRLANKPSTQPLIIPYIVSQKNVNFEKVQVYDYSLNCRLKVMRFAPQCHPFARMLGAFVEWAQSEIAVVPDFHKRILFSDEAHFWLNGYVNKQNCRIWSEANPQVYVESPLHPEKLTVGCALWAGGILLQKR
ncbi:hypothetical protein TNCV_3488901 [Trichonephila clavipes]|nr:hypothetical protein TNCV_3488901 [Trichonephila clavipes]